MSDLVAAVDSAELDVDDKSSMYCTPLCRVRLNDNHNTSHCQQIKNIASFIRSCYRNICHWQNRQTRASGAQRCQQPRYQRDQNHPDKWSNYNWSSSFNQSLILSTNTGESAKGDCTNFSRCSEPPASNRNYENRCYTTHPNQPPSNIPEPKN